MYKITVDQAILQKETAALLKAIAVHRKAELEKAGSISQSFEAQAQGMDALIGNFVDSLQSMAGKTIIDILNGNNSLMLRKPFEDRDFGDLKPADDNHGRFIDLTNRTYIHAPTKGFMGEVDEKKTSKKILHDYLDATVMYYSIVRKQLGHDINPILIEEFLRKGHEFIAEIRGDGPGNIVPFSPGNRPK